MKMFESFSPRYTDEEKQILKETTEQVMNKLAENNIKTSKVRNDDFGFKIKSEDIGIDVQLLIVSGDIVMTIIIYVTVTKVSDVNERKAIMLDSYGFKAVGMCIKFPKGFSDDADGFIAESMTFPLRAVNTRVDGSVRWYVDSGLDEVVKKTLTSLDILNGYIQFFCKGMDENSVNFGCDDYDCDINITEVPRNVNYINNRYNETIESINNNIDEFGDAVEPDDEISGITSDSEGTEDDDDDDEQVSLDKLMEDGFEPPEKYKDIFYDDKKLIDDKKFIENARRSLKEEKKTPKAREHRFGRKPIKRDVKLNVKDISCVSGESDIEGFKI